MTVTVVNFTPRPRIGYRIGVPVGGTYTEVLNSDAEVYGGSNIGNLGAVIATDEPSHGHDFSIALTVPPLAFVMLKPRAEGASGAEGAVGAVRVLVHRVRQVRWVRRVRMRGCVGCVRCAGRTCVDSERRGSDDTAVTEGPLDDE